MIKPPGDLGRGRILEVDNDIFLAIKVPFIKKSAGAVHQAAELKLGIRPYPLAVKTREHGGRSGAVKALAMIKNPYFQSIHPSQQLREKTFKAIRNDTCTWLLSSDPPQVGQEWDQDERFQVSRSAVTGCRCNHFPRLQEGRSLLATGQGLEPATYKWKTGLQVSAACW